MKFSIINYFIFLDYIAYHFYDLTFKTLFKKSGKESVKENSVSFQLLNKKNRLAEKIENLNKDLIKSIYKLALKNFSRNEIRILYLLRNIFVHRFNPGVDNLLKSVHSSYYKKN